MIRHTMMRQLYASCTDGTKRNRLNDRKKLMGDRAAAASFFNTACTAVHETNIPNRFNPSYQLFSSACLTDPTWSEAFYQAGNNCSDLEMKEAAIANYRRGLEC